MLNKENIVKYLNGKKLDVDYEVINIPKSKLRKPFMESYKSILIEPAKLKALEATENILDILNTRRVPFNVKKVNLVGADIDEFLNLLTLDVLFIYVDKLDNENRATIKSKLDNGVWATAKYILKRIIRNLYDIDKQVSILIRKYNGEILSEADINMANNFIGYIRNILRHFSVNNPENLLLEEMDFKYISVEDILQYNGIYTLNDLRRFYNPIEKRMGKIFGLSEIGYDYLAQKIEEYKHIPFSK